MKTNDNFRWYVIKDDFLSSEECTDLIKITDSNEETTIGSNKENNTYIGLQAKWVTIKSNHEELLNRYWNLAKLTNQIYFNFDIEKIQHDGFICKKYSHDDFVPDKYVHTDFAPGWPEQKGNKLVDTTTKITMVTFLNDDFDGGELRIWSNIIPAKKGRVVIFPSFAGHKVLTPKNKDRYSMITFIQGNTFK